MFKKKNKEKQIKKSGITVVSADKAIVRNSEVSKTAILISYHLVDYLAYICLVAGVIVFFAIPIVGMFVVSRI